MKIKEIDRTANVAWSPVEVDPVYLAVGTAAQQLDSSFSTNATLELYQFDIHQSGLDLPVKATLPCDARFHKIIWGSHGIEKSDHPMGIIVGGCDNGVMQVYDAQKILKNQSPLIMTKTKHQGPVRALDFNPFRPNLVASGASDSEIFIWDLDNPKTPMTPGTKVQPADDVSHLAWNKQVEHILASTFPTRCVVWDLRKNEPVIKVSDTTSRIRYKVVEWHPEVATQMCLASEDDNSPVIQLWDLRYATAPLKVIHGHQRGILGLSWCKQDSDLLLSCGKEARILCWNPNFPHPGYEMVCDIPTSSQYSFDVSFCPKNPIVIASSSYDGRVSIFGLSGGVQHPVTSSKLADSFPGMDLTLSAPLPSQQPAFLQLRDAPKWLKRPCGATFAFGGKLIAFSNTKIPSTQPGQPATVNNQVNISQLITLPNLIERSKKLEETLHSGSLESYCADKAIESGDSSESKIWEFLQANFSQNPRQEYLTKLGFNTSEILAKLDTLSQEDADVNGIIDDFEGLGRGDPDGYSNGLDFGVGNAKLPPMPEPEIIFSADDKSIDGKINQALLCGSIDLAVNLCLEDKRWADALLLASKSSQETLTKVQNKYFQKCQNEATQMIRAVVTHDLGKLVERSSLDSWKQVLAIITTYSDEKEFPVLADMLGQRLQGGHSESQKLGALLCCICSGNLNHLVDVWVSDSSKHKGNSPDELQDLVEQVMVLKKAGELWGRDGSVDGGPLASKLVQYAGLLASQGCLELALNFLGESNDPEMEGLKDRLYHSLRCTRPTKAQIHPRSRQSSESSLRASLSKRPSYPNAGASRGSIGGQGGQGSVLNHTDFSNLTGPVHPPSGPYGGQQQHPQQQQQGYGNLYVNSNVQPSVGQFTPPMSNPPMSGFGTAPPLSAGLPPRPPSSVAAPSFYNPPDVPVNSGPAFPPPPTGPYASSQQQQQQQQQQGYGNAYNSPPSAFAPVGPPPPRSSTVPSTTSIYNPPDAPPVSSVLPPPSFTKDPNASRPNFGSSPFSPNTQSSGYGNVYNPQQMTGSSSAASSMTARPPSVASSSIYNPADAPAANNPYGSSFSQPSLSGPSLYNPSNQSNTSGYGNSYGNEQFTPPMLSNNPQMSAFGTASNVPQRPPSVTGLYNPSDVPVNSNVQLHASEQPPQRIPLGSSLPQPPVSSAAHGWNDPPPIKPKIEGTGSIPTEHMTLIDTLESLRSECYEVAHLSQMKRKLEDVARKLEIFCERLKNGSLSEGTLQSLHSLVDAVRVKDYHQALQIHTQLVTAGNFVEISTFLPAIKVLIQSALQLSV